MDTATAPLSPPALPAGAVAANSLSFQGLAQLKAAAQADPRSPQAIRAVAQQFEALLLQQMLGAMDATRLGPDLLGDSSGPMFKSLFNQQLASSISQGQGIGLASFLARELASRYGQATPPAAAAAAASGAAAAQSLAAYRSQALPTAAVAPSAGTAANAAPAGAAPALRPAAPASPPTASAAEAGGTLAQARQFIADILPSVQTAARQLGVTPVAILAQAALETGWGRHTPGNNLFGIKAGAGWSGDSVQALSQEVRNGVARLGAAAFRAYQSAAQSVQNYAALLSRPRYESARGQGDDVSAFASALQRSGYATDPDYAAKLVAVARSPRMQQILAELGVDSTRVVR